MRIALCSFIFQGIFPRLSFDICDEAKWMFVGKAEEGTQMLLVRVSVGDLRYH